jgi:hypothetical protein
MYLPPDSPKADYKVSMNLKKIREGRQIKYTNKQKNKNIL